MRHRQLLILLGAVLLTAGALWWRSVGPVSGHIVDVKVPQLSSVEQEGKTLFDANCAVCHGVSAGGSDKGPPLVHIYYEPGHHGDEAFYFGVQHGVRQHHWKFGNMPPVAGVSEADVTRIITYVRALQRNNGIH